MHAASECSLLTLIERFHLQHAQQGPAINGRVATQYEVCCASHSSVSKDYRLCQSTAPIDLGLQAAAEHLQGLLADGALSASFPAQQALVQLMQAAPPDTHASTAVRAQFLPLACLVIAAKTKLATIEQPL